jgi:hypothetical protein
MNFGPLQHIFIPKDEDTAFCANCWQESVGAKPESTNKGSSCCIDALQFGFLEASNRACRGSDCLIHCGAAIWVIEAANIPTQKRKKLL